MRKILIIDDDASFRETLEESLEDFGYSAETADGVQEALPLLRRSKYGLIFIDFEMPRLNGLQGIEAIRKAQPQLQTPIIMVTSHTSAKTTVEAIRAGAADHLVKPLTREKLKNIVEGHFLNENPHVADSDESKDFELIGKSEEIREVLKLIGRVAAHDSSVLITGETGTGKEVVAQLIHKYSERSEKPFIAVNCAAIPEALLESELFGHSRGAFTGAVADRKGAFERAAGGTIFLDEIGDMDLQLQAKLLRVLQERQVTPVGSSKVIEIDARFLAATHQNLGRMVETGEFRADLFFRLNVIEIPLPALRSREGDIALLANSFLASGRELSTAALTKLAHHPWPGNVRELKNVIERAMILSQRRLIDANDIHLSPSRAENASTEARDLPAAIRDLEKRFIEQALRDANQNRSEAARRLGIGRQLLHTKLKEFGI